ncbi:alpha/beta hydrolase [Halomonas mongoliensis]|uniref:Alpha/beta hydrolase n=1 Tax=Halomonas mongoliensis TaxID=321265 RepID=A0ABU1GIK4_9GAMM|nr:alpha/beta hydrolase [Halomonas mongoliensis]MDR5891826.1 alpha/beta hydrolase [Halomonas mongoliensis]
MQAVTLETPAGGIHAVRWRPETPEPAVPDPKEPPIVLLHDSLGCVGLWRDFPALLAHTTDREVIAYDRQGYGRSSPYPGPQPASFIADEPRDAFARVREHFALERFVALGHSVGGGMAVEVAGQHADGCQALITVAAQAFIEPRTLAGIREAEAAFAEPGALGRLERHHGDKAEWVLRSWVENWHSEAFEGWQLDAALARVSCPALAIHGEHDEYGSLAQPRRIAALTPGPADPVILPCGHVPHRECPERLAAIVAAFLAASN